MSTSLHSLIDIFNSDFQMETGNVQLKKIVIPSIQRDYAQGRLDPDVTKVRERFLNALYNAVTETPITLDFVYGDIDENGILTPLDGQQRLTTLFLLHWYAAKKEGVPQAEYEFLDNFSYETRYSARYFCHELIGHMPTFEKTISEEIIDQAWFPLDWQKDPTISSMLNMLDAINAKFKEVENLWDTLKNNAITFYFLPIKDMGLTDELYIKMNSRGKPLTLFEHFKAELERELRAVDEPLAVRIMNKIDLKWTDLLWAYRNSSTGNGDDNIIDDEFLRYFKFICDIICYEQGNSPQERSNDEFELLETYFSAKNAEETIQNILTLEKYFDCWCHIDGFDNPTEFLESFMTFSHEYGKVTVDQRYILVKLLETNEIFTDDVLTAQINAFIQKCESSNTFPWEYYYVKYPVCRPGKYGKLSNDDTIATPYMYSIMQTKTQWSSNTYIPYFKAIDNEDKYISRDEYGQRMVFDHSHIICENASYVVRKNDTEEILETISISQNENGIDTENRIDKLAVYIETNKPIGVK